jgi:hypothetical protein
MTYVQRIIIRVFNYIVGLYPTDFKTQFGDEMTLVFSDVVEDSIKRGLGSVINVLLIEIKDAPLLITSAYWFTFLNWFTSTIRRSYQKEQSIGSVDIGRSGYMRLTDISGKWDVDKRREAIIASLPPLIFGFGITLSWLIIGNHWYDIPQWQIYTGVSFGIIAGLIIAIGALIGLIKRLPVWSYTWLGSVCIGFILVIGSFVDELIERGYEIPKVISVIGNMIVLLIIILVISFVANRGWQLAGLLGIGLASTMGLSLVHTIVIPPYNRFDLVYISTLLGLLTSVMIYNYILADHNLWQLGMLIMVGAVNIGTAMVASFAWLPRLSELGKPSPMVPLIIIITGLLLVGPILGVIGRSIKQRIKQV